MTNQIDVPRQTARLALGLLLVGAALGTVSAAVPLATPTAAAADRCDRWASSRGSDDNDGTSEARAVGSLATLVALLQPGQTGCIPAGDTFVAHGAGVVAGGRATAASPVVITSGPGGRATIKGGVLFNGQSHDIVLRDVNVVGDGFVGNAIQVEGQRIRIADIDVSHPLGICIGVGSLNGYQQAYEGTEATGVVIERSRVHDCGNDPSLAPRFADDRYSGNHGIYVVNARGTQIRENAIYDNQYRGVQAYPYARDTVIERNVFDRNATHINIGSTLVEGYPWRSSGTIVRDNIMSNRAMDFRADKNPAQVHGYFPYGTDPAGNLVTGNCVADEPGATVTGNGIEIGQNTVGAAQYVNRAAKDFRQTSASACRAFGPTWSRSATPAPDVSREPAVDCTSATAQVRLPADVTTPTGTPTWTYSRIWHRVNGGSWTYQTWFAAQANTGVAQTSWWHRPAGGSWARIGQSVDLGVAAGRVDAWEQRYELVGGTWRFEWHFAGTCSR